jgi:predicted Zn-dependent peptidase
VDLLSDLVLNPALREEDIEREKKVVLEEIKMVEDTPDDLVHEVFIQQFWDRHPLGRPILGSKDTVEALTAGTLRDHFTAAYVASNIVVAAAGNLHHAQVRDLLERAFAPLKPAGDALEDWPPRAAPRMTVRTKDLEQAHVVLGTPAFAQNHQDRYVGYILNTVLGGSMSSRLFQNVREKRGLAYAVFSGLNAYRDAGALTIYAGCAADSVAQVVDLVVEELKGMKTAPVTAEELRRAKDHLKGSLMLSLENTASRMSHLARQEIYFERQFGLDETLDGIEAVTPDDVMRVAGELFANGSLAATVLGPARAGTLAPERLNLG